MRCSTSVTKMRGSAAAKVFAIAKRWFACAMVSKALRGFCGLTSHQTWSRFKRFSASRLMCKWPSWAGLKEPPNIPIRLRRRSPKDGRNCTGLRPDLPVTTNLIFERGELFDSNWASGMKLACCNTYFSTHAEFTPISELC